MIRRWQVDDDLRWSCRNADHYYISQTRCYLDIKTYEMYCLKSIADVEKEEMGIRFIRGHNKSGGYETSSASF